MSGRPRGCDLSGQLGHDALAVHGRIDGLVNNAGLVTRNKIEETDAEFFDHIIGVTRAPLLIRVVTGAQEERGVYVEYRLHSGLGGQENLVAYSMSKGALMTMTRNLADSQARHKCDSINSMSAGR